MRDKTILELLSRYSPEVQREFLDAIGKIRSRAEIARITRLLEAGDLAGAATAVGVSTSVFSGVQNTLESAYISSGAASVSEMTVIRDSRGIRLLQDFDARNPRAEAVLKVQSSRLVTAITRDQRNMIRDALEAGMSAGRNPRSVALDLVGRINPVTKRREGGMIGLTSAQGRAVTKARSELSSRDMTELKGFLDRKRRDRRFDATIRRAVAENKPLTPRKVSQIAGRYSDSLLQLRGETIARTETLRSIHEAQDEAFRQAVDTGAVRQQDVRRVWRTAGDPRVRDTHGDMEGQTVGLGEAFISGGGAQLMYPGDSSAPASETINCRCVVEERIDFLANME